MATPPLPFLTSTQHDRSRPSNSAVPKVKTVNAPHHAGAAMFMRSTHGCGISAGPMRTSFALEAFLSQKQKESACSPGLDAWKTWKSSQGAWETRKALNVAEHDSTEALQWLGFRRNRKLSWSLGSVFGAWSATTHYVLWLQVSVPRFFAKFGDHRPTFDEISSWVLIKHRAHASCPMYNKGFFTQNMI